MMASVIFGSGNYPKMSDEELFQSRYFEVFGNSADCGEIWRKVGRTRKVLRRVYVFKELINPHRFGLPPGINKLQSFETHTKRFPSRGV